MTASTADATSASTAATTQVGVTGSTCRAEVTSWGDVVAHTVAGPRVVTWHVAAEDRWHTPSTEHTVRQRRIDGTPVVETRLRVVDGDAVQRVWAVPDHGGLVVVEVENDSPLPVAVAFAGDPVLTERPPADVPIRGIDLPEGTIVLPVGHRTSVRVAVAHDPDRAGRALGRVPAAHDVVSGWTTVSGRASRLVLPDDGLVEAVTAARCDLLLAGPVEAASDQVGFVFDVAELVRLGEPADAWLPEIVEAVAAVARRDAGDVGRAIEACERMMVAAGDERAAGDLAALRRRRQRDGRTVTEPVRALSTLVRGPSAGRFVADVERCIADGACLLPGGMPRRWLGANFEVHRVPTGPRSAVSFAVRWHGERPALLWEQHGDPVELSAPAVDAAWRSAAASGETLWAPPPSPTRLGLTIEASER